MMSMRSLKIQQFQSTLPRGSDNRTFEEVYEELIFQSTLPRGSDYFRFEGFLYQMDFNPRYREVATINRIGMVLIQNISIHATAR